MRIGFSTGSLALGNFHEGLRRATHARTTAVELSALREEELDPLLQAITSLEESLRPFEYVSLHAPSRLKQFTEKAIFERLHPVKERGWAIIVHPDIVSDYSVWRGLGSALCLENMDKRKNTGRTATQMERLFAHVPEATFCFDIGHARQIDPTMQEARAFLTRLGARLRQIHMSYVNTNSLHEPLNYECYEAFSRVLRFLDPRTPVILETPVAVGDIERELDKADAILRSRGKKPINTGTNCWTASTNGPLSASSCERRG